MCGRKGGGVYCVYHVKLANCHVTFRTRPKLFQLLFFRFLEREREEGGGYNLLGDWFEQWREVLTVSGHIRRYFS